MDNDWAIEQLQVIRTLMERSALYRRALAPIMTLAGVLGTVGALGSAWVASGSVRAFVGYWLTVGVAGAAGALLLVRRQALRASEPFWSLPMRRVVQALFPPFLAGLILTVGVLVYPAAAGLQPWCLPALWMLLYACGVHSAGFFVARGIKLFSWAFLISGCGLLWAVLLSPGGGDLRSGSWLMGLSFGGFHLAYGVYLYFTEKGGATT